MNINICYWSSPVGELILGEHGGSLCLCDWTEDSRRAEMDARLQRRLDAEYIECVSDTLIAAIGQLQEYFSGDRQVFDVPLLCVGTDFQRKVWDALMHIPYGRTVSYSDLAREMACHRAVRAVASACRSNIISIFVPCHRVIGADGKLTGYAGGIEAKSKLIGLERDKCLILTD